MARLTEREVRMRSMLAEISHHLHKTEKYYLEKGTLPGRVRAAQHGVLAKRVDELLDETAGD